MKDKKISSYKDLIVWQKSMELVIEIYNLTEGFPRSELYGLTSQIRRAAVSIPSNIAEGSQRGSKKDYRQFLLHAFSSGAELETQIEIAKNLNICKNKDCTRADSLLLEVMKILNKIIAKLKD